MNILLVILGIIRLLAGSTGCSLPILPGSPAAHLTSWLLHFTGYAEFTIAELVVWGLLAVLAQAIDYVTPMLGTKYSGGSKQGNWGYVVGAVADMFVFPPWGTLLGPFVGELLGGKASGDALKAGFGVFAGFLLSVMLEVTLCGYFIYSFVRGIVN